MIYGYARVSTLGQAREGNSLEGQTKALQDAGAEKIFCDSFTGTKIDRPEFDKLRALLKSGDTLMVTKLDRFARSATQGSQLIEDMIHSGITVHILNMGILDSTPTGKLIRTIMLGFAEFERDMILQRTQEGKEIARSKGIRVDGRPKLTISPAKVALYRAKQAAGEISVVECCRQLGVSRTYWYKVIAKQA